MLISVHYLVLSFLLCKWEHMIKSTARLFIIALTFAALLKTAYFKLPDEAFYITAFVMFVQSFFNTIECLEDEAGLVRFWISVGSFAASVIGGFICYSDVWEINTQYLDSSGWHMIIVIILFLAYFRLVLEEILPFYDLCKKIKQKGIKNEP